MNIDIAQHRLLEVLMSTQLNGGRQDAEAEDPLLALSIGLVSSCRNDADGPGRQIGPVFAALADLVLAVRSDAHRAQPNEFGTL
jgi:hypothetical protein